MAVPHFTTKEIQKLFADKLIVVIGDSGKRFNNHKNLASTLLSVPHCGKCFD